MDTTRRYRRRFVTGFASALAVAAIAAPLAHAAQVTVPTELSGRQFGPSAMRVVTIPAELSGRQLGPTLAGVGVSNAPGTVPAALGGRQFGPSELALVTIPESLSSRELGPATFTTDIPVAARVADAFDWRDAGVGAALAAAVALMLGTLALVVAGRRREPAGASIAPSHPGVT